MFEGVEIAGRAGIMPLILELSGNDADSAADTDPSALANSGFPAAHTPVSAIRTE